MAVAEALVWGVGLGKYLPGEPAASALLLEPGQGLLREGLERSLHCSRYGATEPAALVCICACVHVHVCKAAKRLPKELCNP